MSAGTSSTRSGGVLPPRAIRTLVARHKLVSLGIAAICALALASIVLVVVGAKAGAVTDTTTCTQWGSANQNRQAAYARLYVSEHGPVPRWGASSVMVINAINAGCFRAYGDDVADSTTVVQAISGNF